MRQSQSQVASVGVFLSLAAFNFSGCSASTSSDTQREPLQYLARVPPDVSYLVNIGIDARQKFSGDELGLKVSLGDKRGHFEFVPTNAPAEQVWVVYSHRFPTLRVNVLQDIEALNIRALKAFTEKFPMVEPGVFLAIVEL